MRKFTAYWESDSRGFYESFRARNIQEALRKVQEYEKTMEFAERERQLVAETKQECYRYQVLEENTGMARRPSWDFMNGLIG